jgi:uncharacterized protein with GYD domain
MMLTPLSFPRDMPPDSPLLALVLPGRLQQEKVGAGRESGSWRRSKLTGRPKAPAGEKEAEMPTYISLVSLTDQGVRDAKSIPERIAATERLFQEFGATLKELFLVMGEYDYVAIAEAPDDETAAKAVLSLGARGGVRTVTFRAFKKDEIPKIIQGLR